MTPGRYYASVMPVAGIIYAIALVVSHANSVVAAVGALAFLLIAAARRVVVIWSARRR